MAATGRSQRCNIRMTGGGPWGFRLFGGGPDYPLVIAKLRKHSKAAESGLQEGDVLLAINGYSCRGLNHPTAMAMVDQAGDNLTFDVLRGTSDKDDVDATFDSMEGSLGVPSSVATGENTPVAMDQSFEQHPQEYATQDEQSYKADIPISYSPRPEQRVTNGYGNASSPSIYRQEETTREGETTRHVTTETSKQQFGSTTVTKVRREEMAHSGPTLSPYPLHERRKSPADIRKPTVFQAAPQKNPSVWQPTNAPRPLTVTSAPQNVKVEHNQDRSVTMSFGFGGGGGDEVKENIAPPSQAPVAKSAPPSASLTNPAKPMPTNYRPGCWHPDNIPDMPAGRPQAPSEPMVKYERPRTPPASSGDESTKFGDEFWKRFAQEEPESLQQFTYQHLMRILMGPPGGYDAPDSPTPLHLKKKKIYSDSSFYDDPEHKYPTIEEQIKMARKVAQSLEDAHNRMARGQNMYMKRKQKAEKWTADYHGDDFENLDGRDDKYYNPNPWKIKTTWQPPHSAPQQHYTPPINTNLPDLGPKFKAAPPSKHFAWEAPSSSDYPSPLYSGSSREYTPLSDSVAPSMPVIPEAPPLPSNFNMVPKSYMSAKLDNIDSVNKNALSMDEFEKMRLLGSKSEHGMDPKLAFSLADDLRQMKGKGGRLFAKRRERSEKWTHGDTDTSCNTTGPNQNVMQKLIMSAGTENIGPGAKKGGYGMGPGNSATLPRGGGGSIGLGKLPQNRLKSMIDPPKPEISPWESAANYGTTEKAFEQIDSYLAMKRGGVDAAVAKSLDIAAQRSYTTPYKPAAAGIPVNKRESKMPEFTSKIKPWTGENDTISSDLYNGGSAMSPRGSNRPENQHKGNPSQMSPFSQQGDTSSVNELKTPSANPSINQQSNDILAPKAPRGWNSASTTSPGGFNPSQNGTSIGSLQDRSNTYDNSQAFRHVGFKAPQSSTNQSNASMSQSWKPTSNGPDTWNLSTSSGPGFGGNMSASWSANNAPQDVSLEAGYCDL